MSSMTLPSLCNISPNDIHVWSVRWMESEISSWEQAVLTPDEQKRAANYRFSRDRERFVKARSSLRWILGGYLGCDASEVQFAYTAKGKPYLLNKILADDLCFNLSHSGDHALIAIVRGRDVGIDIEHVRPIPDPLALAYRYFNPLEHAVLAKAPKSAKLELFFCIWTRKEAYLKARGDGLGGGFARFTVPTDCTVKFSLIEDIDTSRWSLYGLELGSHTKAAVVVSGSDPLQLQMFEIGPLTQ